MTTLPNDGPTAVRVIHDKGVLPLTEGSARSLVDLLRAAASTRNCLEVTVDMRSTQCAIKLKMTPDRACAYVQGIEAALNLWVARSLGKPIGKVDRFTRDAAHEITEMRTNYQY